MKSAQFLFILLSALILSSCTRELKSYQFQQLDVANNTLIISMDTPLTKTQFLHTAMYVLDSTNHVLKLNTSSKIGIEVYNNPISAQERDTSNLIGKYEYYFDTKEEVINFIKK